MLADDALSTFYSRGLLGLEQVLPPTLVLKAQSVVRSALELQGLFSHGVWRFDRIARPLWPHGGKNETVGKKA